MSDVCKKNTRVFAAVFLSIALFSFLPIKKFIPPGTIPVKENYFVDECEVDNLGWKEFVWWTAKTYGYHSPEHLAAIPDTTVWLDKSTYDAPYAAQYYRHKAYEHYPVVGVSYEQAVAFCAWRSERVMEAYKRRYKKSISLTYRLPTKTEWEEFAASDSVIVGLGGLNSDGRIALNCAREDDSVAYPGMADVTAPVFSYWKNKAGLFQCLGNVAEMVSEKNVAKGGSWVNKPADCTVTGDLYYSKPAAWLGFRCICVIN